MATQEEMNVKIIGGASLGYVNIIEACIKKGADLNFGGVAYLGSTPLHWAAWKGYENVVELLLNEGAFLSVVDNEGQTPLHWVAGSSNTEVVDHLLKKGASLSVVDNKGMTPLHFAAMNGRTEVVDLLLDKGASVSVVDNEGSTPLHWAAGNGRTVVVDHLIKRKGTSLSVVDNKGMTPLHFAAMDGRKEVISLLLKEGAYISVVDNQGVTPLYFAARDGRTEVVDLLLKEGASLSVVDNQCVTPLHFAARDGTTDLVDILLKNGASLSVMDNQGQTPLHWAAKGGRTEVVFCLLKEGASLSVVDNQGKTPNDIVHGEAKDLLQKYSNTDEIVAQYQMMDTIDEMNELLSMGTYISYENYVYVGGVCNVGQSTLCSILIGEEISQHWKSTDGLNIYFGRNGIDLKKKEMVPLKQATIQEDLKEEIRKKTYKIEIAPSDLVGFGGQRSFDMPHQLCMRHKGTFVLMFNGSIKFSDRLKGYEQEETTESILKHLVNSILSYCADDEDILPKIMFCATHSDDVINQEDRKDRKKKLIHDLGEIFRNHKRQDRIIYDDIFFINGLIKNDPEIMELKFKLVEVACQQKSWGKRMPMAWVPLDLQMSELRLHNMNIISKEELMTLNQRNEGLTLNVKQIKCFLNVQHSLGKILYFDQQGLDHFIIVQPQSLVNILRSFITDKNFWPENKELKGILITLTKTGEITKQNLLKLWLQEKFHQHMQNDDFKEFIIQVLVHLNILGKPRNNKPESYLVPCMVKHRPPETDVKPSNKRICLSYTLLKSSIHDALIFSLICAAINAWPLQKRQERICLYHQAAIFCIDGSNELHLSVEDDKIFVYLINKEDKSSIRPHLAYKVQEYLTLTMTKVLKFYHKSSKKSLFTSEISKAFELEVGEWCTSERDCYISVPKLKEQTEWICKHNKKHDKKYPRYWIFNKDHKNEAG